MSATPRPTRMPRGLEGQRRWYYRGYVIEQHRRAGLQRWEAHLSAGLGGDGRVVAIGSTLAEVYAKIDRREKR